MTIAGIPRVRFAPFALIAAAFVVSPGRAPAADAPVPFEGATSAWHEGFDRYDYLIDEASLEIRPFKRDASEQFGIKDPPAGKRRCVIVAPRHAALGNPWSWRGCYWDHQPQVEVELLKRGFHIAYISANAQLKPDKSWDAWYAFLTEKHGLSKTPNFIGMSRGGAFAYNWATANPSKVSCIYADNPAIEPESIRRLGDLAAADVPILHVCGSIDPLLGRYSTTIETIYRQFGGRISVMIKEGAGHHPHSLRDPTPIADFISRQAQPAAIAPPAYLGDRVAKSSFSSSANSFRYFPAEERYITCRGPWFGECFNRFDFGLPGVEGTIDMIVPQAAASGKPWVFRCGYAGPEAAVDLALLAKGFHIVTGPVGYNADGPSLQSWNAVYQLLIDHGFSKRPVLEGAGGAAGEAYAWAIANSDKVSCIYAENPLLHCNMTQAQPLDHLDVLAKAAVPLLHVCGSLDPLLERQTRVAERRYHELNGEITVLADEGKGHFPTAPADPARAVSLILKTQTISPGTQSIKEARSSAPLLGARSGHDR
ncbi:MAG TPA: hypothetical protein VHX65_10720 [Pirellulales bacterium]|jgi:pimeloyl-ACP methyl ester carboxylesterase|nr:hypothetical protein [Pirellulales bacterium]